MVMAGVHFGTLVSFRIYTPSLLIESLLAVIPAILVIPLGASFAGRIKKQVFDNIILILLGASCLKLFHSALWGG